MSALDQAFIKAYANASSSPPSAAPPVAVAEPPPRPIASPSSTTAHVPNTRAPETASPMLDQLYADGVYYRLDAQEPSRSSSVPAPHFETNTAGARRSARRHARRAALEAAAQIEAIPSQPMAAPPRPQRRLWTRNVVEIARRLASGQLFEEECELTPEILVQPPPKPLEPAGCEPPTVNWPSDSPLNVVVQPNWDAPPSEWQSTPVSLLSNPSDWLRTSTPASVYVDLTPQPIADRDDDADDASDKSHGASKRSFRVDGAHRPSHHRPHRKPGKKLDKQVVDDVIAGDAPSASKTNVETKPEASAAVSETVNKPQADAGSTVEIAKPPIVAPPTAEPAIAASAAATTVAETSAPVAEAPSSEAIVHRKPCVPLWEVDHFLWPSLCNRLISDEHSYFAEAGEKLLAATRDGLKSLAVTGSRRGEGRTTLALSLARSAAKAGLSVAVVDADFAKPQLASMIGLEISHGWQDAALGKIPLSEAAIKSLADKLTVLPLEGSTAGNSLSLADPRVTATLRALNATFDLVILDLGPLSPGSEPLFPAGEACPLDAAVVVRDLRYASLAETQAIGARLQAAGLEAVGIAENFVEELV